MTDDARVHATSRRSTGSTEAIRQRLLASYRIICPHWPRCPDTDAPPKAWCDACVMNETLAMLNQLAAAEARAASAEQTAELRYGIITQYGQIILTERARADAAEAVSRRLQDALAKYGQHHLLCRARLAGESPDSVRECICGLDAALAPASPETPD